MQEAKAASVMFRAKFSDAMKACGLHEKIPPEVWKTKWVVHCKAVGDGSKALRYLAAYVYRVAITDRRIVKVTPRSSEHDSLLDMVTFQYRPGGSKQYKTMQVTAEQFIRRLLQHVLPRGLQKVRHYGFLHPASRTRLRALSLDRDCFQKLGLHAHLLPTVAENKVAAQMPHLQCGAKLWRF